jgi:isopenicillin N synthase-like dioxygenase
MADLNIPTLDMGQLESDPQGFSRALGDAYGEFGFVGLVNHGIPDAVATSVYDAVREFFALPLDTKSRYELGGKGGARGYTRFGVEHAKGNDQVDLKEFWHVGRELPADHPAAGDYPANVWPAEVAGFKEATGGLFEGLEGVGFRVLEGVALSLGLPRGWLRERVNYGNSILRPIHYPPIKGNPEGVRAGRHEDINVLTLLVGSGEPGLEILTQQGEWLSVDTIPGTIVCNVGDMLQRLTNHRLRSTTHRVVNPPPPWGETSRYSIPFFLHFNSDFLIETLPGCVDRDNADRYPEPITAQDFLDERLREIGLLD